MERRHAYLIIAHGNFEILKKLLQQLDDVRNDIYVHIDKKVRVDLNEFRLCVTQSKLIFVPRMRVQWGGYSMIRCELHMMRAAITGEYRYFHLLSGVDLPLKTQDAMHGFFEKNDGKEFVSAGLNRQHMDSYGRIGIYHPLHEIVGKRRDGWYRGLRGINRRLTKLQKKLGIDRTKKLPFPAYKGANWFDITDDLARYILEHEAFIRKHFRMTRCADEMFLQTIAANSRFLPQITDTILRYQVWNVESPRNLRMDDYDAIVSSGMLFARKFDEKEDFSIIERLCEIYGNKTRNHSDLNNQDSNPA